MEDKNKEIIYVPVEDILPNRFQPRLAFDEKELNELANSIIKYGVIQPIVLRKIGEKYEIIAGERRYKASCLAGLKKIPAIVNQTDDNTSAEIALLENIQRKNLSVIEEAQSYKKLMDKGFTQDDIATKLGISQSSVANKMRLLNLPKEVQNALLYNRISERHARSLLSLNNEDLQKNLLNRIINERLTVKQTEEEIGLLLHREKELEEIPDDIKKFLNPESPVVKKEDIVGKSGVEEFLDMRVPDVVDISSEIVKSELTEYSEEQEIINPFQSTFSNMNNVAVNNEPSKNVVENNNFIEQVNPYLSQSSLNNYVQSNPEVNQPAQNNTINPLIGTINDDYVETKKEEEIIQEDSLLNEYGEVNLPKVINKVRDFIIGLDEVTDLIETSEVDLPDRYQIVIEINKNTPM